MFSRIPGLDKIVRAGVAARTHLGLGTGDSPVFAGLDVNGGELVLDADGDTSITADSDDQIDIKIAGADDFSFKANTFEVQTGSNIDMNGTELILDADGDTSVTADSDDTIDFRIAGADDFQMTANTLSVLSGSTLNIDSGATIANSGTATGFGGAAGLVLLDTQTASASATLDFTTGISSTHSVYLFVFENIIGENSTERLRLLVSDDAGASWEEDVADYRYILGKRETNGSSWVGAEFNDGAAFMNIAQGAPAADPEQNGQMWMYNAPNAASYTFFQAEFMYLNNDTPSIMRHDYMTGMTSSSKAAVDGVQFYKTSGNLTSGVIRMYGLIAA